MGSKGIVVIVTGGRDYSDAPQIWKALDRLDLLHGIALVVEGASDDVTGPYRGVDYWAHQWGRARGKRTQRVHADWKKLGESAGPIRNRVMLDKYSPYLVIVFPGGRGTLSMKKIAKEARIKTVNAFDWMKD